MTNDDQTNANRVIPKALALDRQDLELLELITSGLLAPIDGYCLPGEVPASWPCETWLAAGEQFAGVLRPGDEVDLTDPDGTPIARLILSALRTRTDGGVDLAGRLRKLRAPEHGPARELRLRDTADLSTALVAVFDDLPDPAELLHIVAALNERQLVLLGVDGFRSHPARAPFLLDALRRCAGEVPRASVLYLPIPSAVTSVDDRGLLDAVLATVHAGDVVDFTGRRDDRNAALSDGLVVLFTGLSGSGKSTLARSLAERLPSIGKRGVLLDGDAVRRVVSAGLGFSASDREENLYRLGWVAARVAEGGGVAVCAPIAPFTRSRERIRAMAEHVGRFVLVYVSTPLELCEQRDRKGLYARARAGELADFTGIDSPYEVPSDADLIIDTSVTTIEDGVDSIIDLITG